MKHINPLPEITAADIDRFAAKVVPDDTTSCHMWVGSSDGRGYGGFWLAGRARRAHRIAYTIAHGPIPDHLVIDHMCGNRGCVNPDHLQPIDQHTNSALGSAPHFPEAQVIALPLISEAVAA